MPKMKSCRGAVKRFKKSKNSIKRGSAYRSHILTKKSPKTQRGLKKPKTVHSTDASNIKLLLCMS
jgi:large subunit ribosomal protein L35